MIEKQLVQGEHFVRISLEDCQWTTMGRNTCWLRCAAQRNTFRFCQSIDEQTQGDDQECDDRHAVAVVVSRVMRDGSSWAQSTTG